MQGKHLLWQLRRSRYKPSSTVLQKPKSSSCSCSSGLHTNWLGTLCRRQIVQSLCQTGLRNLHYGPLFHCKQYAYLWYRSGHLYERTGCAKKYHLCAFSSFAVHNQGRLMVLPDPSCLLAEPLKSAPNSPKNPIRTRPIPFETGTSPLPAATFLDVF